MTKNMNISLCSLMKHPGKAVSVVLAYAGFIKTKTFSISFDLRMRSSETRGFSLIRNFSVFRIFYDLRKLFFLRSQI